MLIWSGWGLAALLPLPLIAVFAGTLDAVGVTGEPGIGVALALTGAVGAVWTRWFDGWREKRSPARQLVDPRTGQQVVVVRRDSLFWIPMRFLWVVYVLLAVGGLAVLVTGLAG
ncbi:hypothetical protein LX16_2731 [Stackebrandtia albiflava]|uniref:Uncharacterized protein n=1 Tax=Stackebrandtia albiflava TaxID=406432 RepID=A0A562V268_9ACTN|nr:hypothetical protein [Stackebrandtia albiflava]TWJ11986.1 hypothetical protein LX16_2731 [Stackebrandtia albiflava]